MMVTDAAVLAAKFDTDVPGLHCTVRGDRIVFSGAPTGEHSLDISTSTEERVRWHWAGYAKDIASKLVFEAEKAAAKDPWMGIRVRSKVTFNRGTKVPPVGRVLKLYRSRASFRRQGGEPMAIVRFAMVNGRLTTYRLAVAALTLLPEKK